VLVRVVRASAFWWWFWCIQVCSGTFWWFLVASGAFWCVLVGSGGLWWVLVVSGWHFGRETFSQTAFVSILYRKPFPETVFVWIFVCSGEFW
jgi:hypothetical protein